MTEPDDTARSGPPGSDADDPAPDDDARSAEIDPLTPADQRLMHALAVALGPADPTDDLASRCEGLLTWIDVDAELASLLDQAPAELAGTRGAAGGTADLEFTIDDGSCVIEIRLADDALRGQILGVAPGQVSLRVVTGVVAPAPVDELGSFEIAHPPPGSARLEIQLDHGRRIHTDWFVI